MNKTIAYITDIHLDEHFPIDCGVDARSNWNLLLNDISSREIDEIIFGGDIGAPSSNKWFFESLNKFGGKLKITLGNHDTFNEVKKYYSNSLTTKRNELYYCYEDNFYKYFFLDSSSAEISPIQFEWIRSELFGTTKTPVIYIHHPVLKVNTVVDKDFPLLNRDTLKELFLSYRQNIIIFCGHYHTEDELITGNIKQVITPAASFQVIKGTIETETNSNIFGYRMIYINDKSINSEVIWFNKIY